jgi:hypothetical protein
MNWLSDEVNVLLAKIYITKILPIPPPKGDIGCLIESLNKKPQTSVKPICGFYDYKFSLKT